MLKKIIATTLLAGLTSTCIAEEMPSFSYVEGKYITIENDALDADGFGIKGSVELGDFFIFADYAKVSDSMTFFDETVDIDVDPYNLGLGYQFSIGDATAMYASAAFGKFDGDVDADTNTIEVGIRSNLNSMFELNGAIARLDIEDVDAEFGFKVGTLISFGESNWGATVDYSTFGGDVDIDSWSVGVRYSF